MTTVPRSTAFGVDEQDMWQPVRRRRTVEHTGRSGGEGNAQGVGRRYAMTMPGDKQGQRGNYARPVHKTKSRSSTCVCALILHAK